jgi:hypothetical protein
VGPVHLVRPYQQVSTPAVDQRTAARIAGPVGEPRPHEVAERAREHDQPELELLLGREERGGDQGAAEQHRDLRGDRDAGGFEQHQDEDRQVAVPGDLSGHELGE